MPVSASKAIGRGVYALQGQLYDATGDRAVQVADLNRARSLPGRHNWQNAAAAYAAVRGLGVSPADIADGLLSFPGLAHRMETVGHIRGVRFVNDSKATNSNAARQALSSYGRVYWIAGGRAKDGGIESLSDLFPRVARAYLIGEAAGDFAQTLEGKVPNIACTHLGAAVAQAFADADLVICRAGASTVTELAAVGVAAVFVPFPHAVDDHQTTNAQFLVAEGGGWLMPQAELTAQSLADRLASLDRAALLDGAEKAHAQKKTNATREVVMACEELAA
jgi:hypothetical protein